jgi:hypothetical protein
MRRFRISPDDCDTVSVNGMLFRWVVLESGHVIVQHGSGHGCCLVVEATSGFLPSNAVSLIRLALDADWEPHQDGPNHWFRFDTANTIPALTKIEPRDELL